MKLSVRLPYSVDDYRCWYDRQLHPQDAYFNLDFDEGELFADYNGEIGNAVSFHYYYGREVHFHFPCDAALHDVQRCMEHIAPLCEELLNTHKCEWDGNNWIGKYDLDLAEKIQAKVDVFLEDYFLTPAYEAEQEALAEDGEEGDTNA